MSGSASKTARYALRRIQLLEISLLETIFVLINAPHYELMVE